MSLPAINFQQKDFTGGQLTESALRRDDSKLIRKGARIASNVRMLNTGGVENRFGRSVVSLDAGRTETIRITGNQKLRLQFSNAAVALRDFASGDLIASATGMPWTTATLSEIKFAVVGRAIVIAYRNTKPKVITLSSAAAATIDRLAGTIISYLGSLSANPSAGFDGNTSQSWQFCVIGRPPTNRYRYGKDFGSNPQKIGSCIAYAPSDTCFTHLSGTGDVGTSFTLDLCASQTAPDFAGNPNSATPGRTVLGTITFNMANADVKTINSNDVTTAWRYVWLETSSVTGNINQRFSLAELQFLTPGGTEQWSVADFAFAPSPAGGLAQPFYRFAVGTTKMTPGQTAIGTGVTVNFNAPVLEAGHVGTYFRYAGKQMLCTGFTSSSEGTFSILEALPPTLPVTVNSTAGFVVGMVVVGATSGASGIISSITSSTVMRVVMVTRYAGFVGTEIIVSSTGLQATVSSIAAAVSPEAIAAWDESALSDFRGWPASVSSDRERLIFCDVPAVPSAVLESKISVYNDFLTGANANESIFELAPGNSRVLHVVGGADQFVIAEDATYYIPISASSPLAPGFVDFRKIGAFGGSSATPVQLKEGIIFGAANGKSVVGILPTFASGAPWQMKDVSEYHSDLFSSPMAFAVASGGDAAAEQYIYVLNSDGTAVVGRYDQGNEFIGFVPYTGTPTLKWISAFVDTVLFNVLNGSVWTLEQADADQFLDGAVFLNTATPALRPDPEDLTKGRLWFWAGKTVDLMLGNAYLGARVVDDDGNITEQDGDDFSDAAVVAGYKWTAQLSPFIPSNQEGQDVGQRLRRRRVKGAQITVQDSSEFEWMGRVFAKNPTSGQPTLFSGTKRGRKAGRVYDPEILFRKTTPGPFRVIEIDGSATL